MGSDRGVMLTMTRSLSHSPAHAPSSARLQPITTPPSMSDMSDEEYYDQDEEMYDDDDDSKSILTASTPELLILGSGPGRATA